VLSDINLRYADDDGEVQTVCNCAVGFDYGRVRPAADCLRSSTCGGAPDKHHPDDHDEEQGKTRPSSGTPSSDAHAAATETNRAPTGCLTK